MPALISTRNVFALIIIGALIVGAIGILMALVNADRPSDTAERERPPQETAANQPG